MPESMPALRPLCAAILRSLVEGEAAAATPADLARAEGSGDLDATLDALAELDEAGLINVFVSDQSGPLVAASAAGCERASGGAGEPWG